MTAATIDTAIDGWMQAHQTPALDRFFGALMWIGTTIPGFVCFGVVMMAVCCWQRRLLVAAAAAAAVVVTQVVGVGIKHLVRRGRPPEALPRLGLTDYSFPSTAVAVCTAGLVVLFALAANRPGRRPLALAFVLLDLAVAAGVVYLGAHWCTDAVGGALVGGAIGWCTRRVLAAVERRRRERTVAPGMHGDSSR